MARLPVAPVPFDATRAKLVAGLATKAAAQAVQASHEARARARKAVAKLERPLVIHYARR